MKDRPTPTPGKCNWPLTSGNYCRRGPALGERHCALHLRAAPPPGTEPSVASLEGRLHFRGMSALARRRIASIALDPELTDGRLTLAISQFLLEIIPIEPTEDQVREVAARLGMEEPTEEQLQVARMDLVERVHRLVQGHGRLQQASARAQTSREVLIRAALPAMQAVMAQVGTLAKRYVPEDRQQAFAAELRAVGEGALQQLAEDLQGPTAED